MIEIDVIGVIYHATGATHAFPMPGGGNLIVPVMAPFAGWHVNTTIESLSERPDLEPFVVTPSALRRVWAGDDATDPSLTVALRFASEAEADAVLNLPVMLPAV